MGCGASPIFGVRYRCVNCANYDLCEGCEKKGIAGHPSWHLFLKIATPLPLNPNYLSSERSSGTLGDGADSSSSSIDPTSQPLLPVLYSPEQIATLQEGVGNVDNLVHDGVTCSNCQKTPIEGIRYTCVNCDQFDLCQECESSGKVKHFPLHLFLQVRFPLPTALAASSTPPGSSSEKSMLPRALISHQASVPFLLHRSVYPSPARSEQVHQAIFHLFSCYSQFKIVIYI